MMKKAFITCCLCCLTAACAPAQSPASAETVEAYLQAVVDRDERSLLRLTCPEYQSDALIEFDALAQVETVLKDVSCRGAGEDEGAALVQCSGSIASSYGTEMFEYDLTGRTYRLVAGGDGWLVCGYTR